MAVFAGRPSRRTQDEALAAMGLFLANPPKDEDVLVWPEAWPALQMFLQLTTQWNNGPAGRTGLRYEAVRTVMDIEEVPRRDRRDLLAQLAVMEAGVLEWLSEKRASRG